MNYDFVADVGVDGGVVRLDGDTTRSLRLAPEHFLHTEFTAHVSDADRYYVTDLLFNVHQGQQVSKHSVSMLDGKGFESPFTLDVSPIFERGIYAYTRIGAKKVDPLEIADETFSNGNQQIAVFEDTVYDMIERGEAGSMSLFSVDDSDLDSVSERGDALAAALMDSQLDESKIARLNDRTTAVLHDASTSAEEITAVANERLGPDNQVTSFSVNLDDDTIDSQTKQSMLGGFLAAASTKGISLGKGTFSLSDAVTRAETAIVETPTPPPEIRLAAQVANPENQIGVASVPELTHPWSKPSGSDTAQGQGGGDALLASVIRRHLESIARAKPEDIPVVVPIDAASLLMIEPSDWDAYDVMVMPVGLRTLDPASQVKVAQNLSSQYVMVDVVDLTHSPAVFAELAKAEALSFLRVDAGLLAKSTEDERAAFLAVTRVCAERGIFVLLSRADLSLAHTLLGSLETVFLSKGKLGGDD